MAQKNLQDEELAYELFPTTRQKTKVRNTFAINMSTDIKLNEVQISRIIQGGGFLASGYLK